MYGRIACFIFVAIWFFGCSRKPEPTAVPIHEPKVIPTTGYVVPADSMVAPEVIQAGKPAVISFREMESVPAAVNVFPAGIPQAFPLGTPYHATPGTAIFEKPIIAVVKDTVVPYVHSEPVPAQRPRFKDDASCNIQYLDVDQGLPNSYVRSMYLDRLGNIWFSTTIALTKYDGKTFTNFSVKEGFLGERTVKAIAEDSKGNLWFGGGKGACKYDGVKFTYYDGGEKGWPGVYVRSILEDKKGNMWFASDRGVSCFDGEKFTCYTEAQGLIDDNALCLFMDKHGNIWIGTDGGVSMFDGKSFTSYTEDDGLIFNRIVSIAEDKGGNIWMCSQAGICKFTGKEFVHYTQKEGLISNDDRHMMIDKAGDVWITCYGGGICKFDGKNFTHLTDKEGLTINIVWCTMEDRSGNIWIGTDGGGVCKYLARSFFHFTAKQGMGKTVMSVFEDNEKNLWLGGYASGLWRYDGKTFKLFSAPVSTTGTVRAMMHDRAGNLWFGSESGGVTKHNKVRTESYLEQQGLASNNVTCIMEDRDGNLWFGTGGGLNKFDGKTFTKYTEKQGLAGRVVTYLLQDKEGNIWIGTRKGLNKFDGKSFTRFSEKEGLSNNDVKNLLEDGNGDLWIGTLGGGLNKYDGKAITIYSETEGLSNNFIRTLVEDKPEHMPKGMIGIWMSTDNGINHLLVGKKQFSDTDTILQELKINIYKREDGLKGEDFTSNSSYLDSKGRIWWGSVKSLTMLDAGNVIIDNEIPQIKLDKIKLEQKFIDFRSLQDSIQNKKHWYVDERKDVDLCEASFDEVPPFFNYPLGLELPYNINNIEFNFSSVEWNSPHKLRYQYILEGADKEWHAPTAETKAVYTSLGSGNYIFKVKAKGFSDIWSEPFEYAFTIHPPWWQTVWAYGFYVLMFIGITLLMIKWRTRSLRERQKELEQTIVERTADVVQEKNRVEEKNVIIEKKQKEILDSINYAKQIQYSLLAHDELLQKNLPEHFVLFKPKDIVSGDFYWATKKEDSFYLAVCDSTGHGIPGAFMSLLNISFLNEAINEKNISEPNKVLDHVRERLIQTMEGQDGMDATLVRFEKNKISYASAYNKPVVVREGTVIELPADKMPVGKGERKNPFTLQTIEVQAGDVLYFFTDGYADQFGGPQGKKFKYKQLHALLVSLCSQPLPIQKEKLNQTIETWKGDVEQVDDICIIGVKI